jgi:hypothetical protein
MKVLEIQCCHIRQLDDGGLWYFGQDVFLFAEIIPEPFHAESEMYKPSPVEISESKEALRKRLQWLHTLSSCSGI